MQSYLTGLHFFSPSSSMSRPEKQPLSQKAGFHDSVERYDCAGSFVFPRFSTARTNYVVAKHMPGWSQPGGEWKLWG